MTEIRFDDRGNIYPYKLIALELMIFQEKFVISFDGSSTRQKIYENYLVYIIDFHKEIVDVWQQWIDGSFITDKKDPNDIDLVNFIDSYAFSSKGAELIKFLTKYGSKDKYKVDGYCVPVYPSDDERYELTYRYMKYWEKWFGHDRSNNPKGIIQLYFNNEIINNLMGQHGG
jgi:hypothetical protein